MACLFSWMALLTAAGCTSSLVVSVDGGTAEAAAPGDAAAPPDLASSTDADATPLDLGDPRVPVSFDRANQALQSLLLYYWDGAADDLHSTFPPSGKHTGYWIFAQALDCVIDGASRTGMRHYAGTIETFYLAQASRGFTSDYLDDENWLALALLRAHQLTQTQKYLDRAISLYADIMANWDETCCGKAPGGIWWNRQHTQKATASNAGPVITGVRLAARTGDPKYLAFAKKVFEYWIANLVDPNTHQVADHIDPNGNITRWRFTYNEGLMLGAAFELYGATLDNHYLDRARPIAEFMVARETVQTGLGPVLFDGKSVDCSGDCGAFKGIGMRYLQLFASVDKSASEVSVLSASAASIWQVARDPARTLFAADWTEAAPATVPVEADIAAAQSLAVFSELLGAPPQPLTSTVLQAEDGVLHHLGLEAAHPGFEGWGYVAGWNADGQWIDFNFNLQKASAALELRYAAGAGEAVRHLFVDGKTIVSAQHFAGTGAWDSYKTVSIPLPLAPGPHTVSLIYAAAKSSTNYLNLDRLTVQ